VPARRGLLIIGLGVDLVERGRVAASFQRWGSRLIGKLMDPPEAERLPTSPEERIAALAWAIAAKEAASKALGTGWSRGVRWRDVVVEAAPSPHVSLLGRAAEVAARLGSSGRTRLTLESRGDLRLAVVHLLG
jgi:holo-[acyl-carrier protein] synthase